MKTQEEIEQQWFPICKCGNLIKITKYDGDISFFIVTKEPKSKKFVAFLNGIELKGIWLSRPMSCGQPTTTYRMRAVHYCSMRAVRY